MTVNKKVKKYANKVSKDLDAMVFVYSGAIDQKGLGSLIKSMQLSDHQPIKPNSLLFLTTLGGNAEHAYQIARLMQTISQNFYLCVPAKCKSAGTLVTLGASEMKDVL